MKFLQELYLGDKVSPKVDQIVKKIKNDQAVPNLYLIVTKKDTKRTRRLRAGGYADATNAATIREMIPYK